jgi:hypothetical protein
MLSTCAVVLLVLVVTLLLSLPPHEEARGPGTSERLPEDGNISPQFNYEGTCTNVLFAFFTFFTHFAQDALYRSV